MHKIQYAYQLGTGQTHKRVLVKSGSKWSLHPKKGAWTLVGVTEDHPFSNELQDPYLRSLGARAVRKYFDELGAVLLAESKAYSVTNTVDSFSSEVSTPTTEPINQTYFTTHGAQVSSRPEEFSTDSEASSVEVDYTPEDEKFLDEAGLTVSQQSKARLFMFMLAIGGVAYGIYHFVFKPNKA